MITNLFLSLISNIVIKISLIKQDFVGFNFDINIIHNLLLGFSFSIGLIIISFLIGNKIRKSILLVNFIHLNNLVDIALGYLLIGTGIGILGFLSLLSPLYIWTYIVAVVIFSISSFNKTKKSLKELYIYLQSSFKEIKNKKFLFIWLMVFILIAFINLINPEIREDQYHIDFPQIYLNEQTIMIPPMEQLHVSAAPLLSEMTYLIGIFMWSQESARYVHFLFYLLVLLTLFKFHFVKNLKFSLYTPILFASAPVVIHETSSMYVDFQWIFMFLLAVFIITTHKKIELKELMLAGLLFGGMVSVKLWTIVFIPVIFLFLILRIYKPNLRFANKIIILLLSIIFFPSIWFIRSYILTGNPFYPAFSSIINLENTKEYYGIFHYIGINTSLISPNSLINIFSPLLFVGIILFLYKIKDNLKLLKLHFFKFTLLILLLYISIQYPFGRYLLGLYVLIIFFSSIGINNFINDFKYSRMFVGLILLIISSYYLINAILVLPYSFGMADKNKYLTRILSRDNSSYYDFGGKFDKYISKEDFVATYKIFGYYYADFKFLDVNFIFNKNNRSFDTLKKKEITKVFTKDYTLEQMCRNLNIKDCIPSKYQLVSSYNDFPNYYLYKIK